MTTHDLNAWVAQQIADGYRVSTIKCPGRATLVFDGHVIADSAAALFVLETNHEPVCYLPRDDVRYDLLQPSELRTYSPFKGEAHYWHIVTAHRESRDAAWSYPHPIPSCPDISGYISFFSDRVEALISVS